MTGPFTLSERSVAIALAEIFDAPAPRKKRRQKRLPPTGAPRAETRMALLRAMEDA